MIVFNENIHQFQLGNNFFNIDEDVSLALYELDENYNWIMEKTNIILEYGVIHEGVIHNIIEALANFFKKVIRTLINIFSRNSSSSGGGGGGGSSKNSSTNNTNNVKEIKIKHHKFSNYDSDLFVQISKELSMKFAKFNDDVFGEELLENMCSIDEDEELNQVLVRRMIIRLFSNNINENDAEEILTNADKRKDFIENHCNDIITHIIKKFNITDNNKYTEATPELKEEIYNFIIGDEKEFTYTKTDASKINNDLSKDRKNKEELFKHITLYRRNSEDSIKSMKRYEGYIQEYNRNTKIEKVMTLILQVASSICKEVSYILIDIFTVVNKSISTHIDYEEKVLNKLNEL